MACGVCLALAATLAPCAPGAWAAAAAQETCDGETDVVWGSAILQLGRWPSKALTKLWGNGANVDYTPVLMQDFRNLPNGHFLAWDSSKSKVANIDTAFERFVSSSGLMKELTNTETAAFANRFEQDMEILMKDTEESTPPQRQLWLRTDLQDEKPETTEAMGSGLVYALRGGNHKYCTDEGNAIKCNRGSVGPREKFIVENAGGGKVALRGGKHQKYCADEGNAIRCNRGSIGPREKFTLEDAGGSKVALRGNRDQKYCALEDDAIKCNRGSTGALGKFTPERAPLPAPRALSCSFLPVATAIGAALLAWLLLRSHVLRHEAPQATRSVCLAVNFVLVLNYTIVILDSYDLCDTLGRSESDSGRMVGTYMLGFCGGSFCSWLAVRRWPRLWRERSRGTILVGLGWQLAGSVAYAVVALGATGAAGKAAGAPVAFNLAGSELLSHLLFLSRFVSGMGSGICQQFYVSGMLHLTPVAERPEHTARWVFSGMLAIGLGPMAAAALQALDLCGGRSSFELVGYVQVLVVLLALLVVISFHPDLKDVEDYLETSQEAEGASGPACSSPFGRRVLICGCLVMTGIRAFGISAIEVAIALSLEKDYLWDQRVTGLSIGGIFLCCIPLRAFHAVLDESLTVVGWIRLFGCGSACGSVLLFTLACRWLPHSSAACAYTLVLAGAVLFPCLYLSDALGSGLMHQHVLPEGSLLDANHAQLWYNLFQGLGRFLGPWLARLSLQKGGQDAFAAEQLGVTCAFLISFEVCVRPYIAPRSLDGCEWKARG